MTKALGGTVALTTRVGMEPFGLNMLIYVHEEEEEVEEEEGTNS